MLADVKTDPYESSCVVLFQIGTGCCCGLPKVHGRVYTGTAMGTRPSVPAMCMSSAYDDGFECVRASTDVRSYGFHQYSVPALGC